MTDQEWLDELADRIAAAIVETLVERVAEGLYYAYLEGLKFNEPAMTMRSWSNIGDHGGQWRARARQTLAKP